MEATCSIYRTSVFCSKCTANPLGYRGLNLASVLRACAGLVIFVMNVPGADAKQLVLNCQITEGVPEPYRSRKIMIDEDAGIVVFGFNEKVGVKVAVQSEDCKGCYMDLSMKITMKNEKV